jgi:hypothetical protein
VFAGREEPGGENMKIDLKMLTRTAILLALTVAFQSLALPQPVTGPLVNAVLFVSTGIIGALSGVLIGGITPWIAYAVGTMKLAPAVPVIMAGNISLVLVFALLFKRNRYVAAVAATVVKWLVMTAGVKYLLLPAVKVPAPVVTSLTIFQLWTALGGAVLAIAVMAALKAWESRQLRI